MKWFTAYALITSHAYVTPFAVFCNCYTFFSIVKLLQIKMDANCFKNFLFVNERIRNCDLTVICALMKSQ